MWSVQTGIYLPAVSYRCESKQKNIGCCWNVAMKVTHNWKFDESDDIAENSMKVTHNWKFDENDDISENSMKVTT